MKQAPDFTLTDQHGNDFRLYDNLDKKVMLVFYPKDNTPVCTKQLCDYSENYSQFEERGIRVVGISIGDDETQKEFAERHGFNFPVLNDKDRKVSKLYDAVSILGLSKRKIVLIDKDKSVLHEDTVFPVFFRDTNYIINNVLHITDNKAN